MQPTDIVSIVFLWHSYLQLAYFATIRTIYW